MAVSILLANEMAERRSVRRAWLGYIDDFYRMLRMQLVRRSM
jgi:hypothetical protein